MKKPVFQTILLAATLAGWGSAYAGASGHAGHEGGAGSGSAAGCLKIKLSKFYPEHLATVQPGSEISFVAVNVPDPEQIQVTVKAIPIEVTTQENDSFMVVKGKLPPDLHGTAARVNIVIKAKAPRCDGEDGWLLKIAE